MKKKIIYNTLDISNIPSWMETTSKICSELVSEKVRKQLKYYDPEEMYSDTMSFLLECCDQFGQFLNYEKWCTDLDDAFTALYTHIKAFHACRIFMGLNSYKEKGIQKLSRNLLRDLAKITFKDYASREDIDIAVDKYKIPAFEKSIYLFTDLKSPLDRSCSHYLQSGSESLQALAIALNIHSRGILASQGQAFLIECDVPLRDVHITFRSELWRRFSTCFFQVEAGNEPPTAPLDFCIRVTKPIGPDRIKHFYEINDKTIYCYTPRH
ncbi:MAG TPA: hypothetical protein PKZ42_10965 [Syntrophales bacterium]|nr:hypothetical protein [Syntrophales bacterium]